MLYDCEVAMYLDLRQAIDDGIPFFTSANQVILTPGIQCVVPAKYIQKYDKLIETI